MPSSPVVSRARFGKRGDIWSLGWENPSERKTMYIKLYGPEAWTEIKWRADAANQEDQT